MHPRLRFHVLVSALVLATAIPSSAQSGSGVFKNRFFDHDGYTRGYRLYVPSAYDGTEDWPLVLSFHGFTQSASSQATMDNLDVVADTAHFLVAYPTGLPIDNPPLGVRPGWNVTGDFGDQNDIEFVGRLIDHIDADNAVDLRRVHATGFSWGGMMSFALACHLSNRIASIGAVAGPMQEKFFEEGCPTKRPVSILEFHGTADSWHPYTGITVADWAPRAVPETISWWARHNNCSTDSLVTSLPDVDPADNSTVTRIEYADCEPGGVNLDTEVVHYRIDSGRHSWPGHAGVSPINMDIDATALIWEFFADKYHPTPQAGHWVGQWAGGTYTLMDVDFVDANLGISVGSHATILRTEDGGATWERQIEGLPRQLILHQNTHFFAVHFSDANTGTVVGQDGTILRTTNGGETWIKQESFTTALLTDVFFTDVNTGTVVGWEGTILRTTNGGESWINQFSPVTTDLQAVFFSDANVGTILGQHGHESGSILRTIDGGVTWTHQVSEMSNPSSVYFTDDKTGTAVGSQYDGQFFHGVILLTSDGGTTWEQQSPDLWPVDVHFMPNDVHFWDENTGIVVGGIYTAEGANLGGAMLTTTDGGETWREEQIQTHSEFRAVDFVDSSVGAVVGGGGTIMKTTRSFSTMVGFSPAAEATPQSFSLHQNFPNPFNPTTTISYDLPRAANASLRVYDVLGRQIIELASGAQPAGTYDISFDAAGLPSGVYFYRLQAGDYVEMRTMVLAK